jgi:hypothetical protein
MRLATWCSENTGKYGRQWTGIAERKVEEMADEMADGVKVCVSRSRVRLYG